MTQAEQSVTYVTSEELADAVQAICDHVDSQLGQVDSQLGHMDSQLGHMDSQLGHMDSQLTAQMAFNRRFFLIILRKLFEDPAEFRAALDELEER